MKLRDHMHVADESTSAVVDMYFDAIRQMQATAREDYSDGPLGDDVMPDADDFLSMGGNDEEDSDRSSQYSEEEVELIRKVDLTEQQQAIGTFMDMF